MRGKMKYSPHIDLNTLRDLWNCSSESRILIGDRNTKLSNASLEDSQLWGHAM